MQNTKDLTNDELVENMNRLVREAEQRVQNGDLQSFSIDAKYANGGVEWTHSSAQCYGPPNYIPDYGSSRNAWDSSWSSSN